MSANRSAVLAGLAVSALTLSACGGDEDSLSSASSEAQGLEVVVSFYPLEFVTSRIAGDLATVQTLTSPGVDPHDAELTPQSVASVQQADMVIYSSGLQPGVDDAVEGQASDHSFDVNPAADLMEAGDEEENDHGEGEDHAEEEHGEEDQAEEEHGDTDPHFWLDPERMAGVSGAIADELAQVDPDHAESYQANADELVAELTTLKQEYNTGLATCSREDLITTHAAFGYIAEPYGLHQISVTGLVPNSEPSAARLAEISAIVEESQATTVYSEVLLGADIAETVAGETGATVRVLDPIEGITDSSPGGDYLEVMRANLESLREGQDCS